METVDARQRSSRRAEPSRRELDASKMIDTTFVFVREGGSYRSILFCARIRRSQPRRLSGLDVGMSWPPSFAGGASVASVGCYCKFNPRL